MKRLAVLHMVKRLGSSVVCLQEIHLSPGQDTPFSVNLFGTQFHSTFSSYARGVSVLIGTNFPLYELPHSLTLMAGLFFYCALWMGCNVLL